MEYIWWKQTTKPRRLLGELVSCFLQGRDLILTLPSWTPWKRTMYELVDEMLRQKDWEHNPVFLPCPDEEPGPYLLENFCEKDKQLDYRFGKTYACFLAQCRDIILHNRYFWISGIPEERLQQWLDFVTDYRKNRPAGENRAVFLLETEQLSDAFSPVKGIPVLSYTEYIEEYDFFAFCTVSCTEVELDAPLRPYLSELAFAICRGDAELCAAVIRQGQEFLKDPAAVLAAVSREKVRSDGTEFRPVMTDREIRNRVWESQVRLIFPIVQRYVHDITSRLRESIEVHLPMESTFGQTLTNPEDLEVGMLYWMAEHHMIETDPEDHMWLDLFRRVRNELAHNAPVCYEDVCRVLSCRLA